MRPTFIQLRNPDEHTPGYYSHKTTYNGHNVDYRANKHHSVKGSISREKRFPTRICDPNITVAPNSYYPEKSYKISQEGARCSSVFSKRPVNQYQFDNA